MLGTLWVIWARENHPMVWKSRFGSFDIIIERVYRNLLCVHHCRVVSGGDPNFHDVLRDPLCSGLLMSACLYVCVSACLHVCASGREQGTQEMGEMIDRGSCMTTWHGHTCISLVRLCVKLVVPDWAPETNVSHKEFGSAVCVSASHNFDREGEEVRTRKR